MKVSIVIPTYNRSALIQETIESVLKQTYSDYEIIVVDDGSTDNTQEALKKFAGKIQYIKQNNRGINNARNQGLRHAKGEYVALLDNDDLWFPWTLSLFVKVLDENPDVAATFSDFFVLKPDGGMHPHGLLNWFMEKPDWENIYFNSKDIVFNKQVDTLREENDKYKIYFGDIYYSSLFGPRVLPSASLYRKSMADEFGIRLNESDSLCGDWEFFARLSNTCQVVYVDVEAACNRSHEDAVRLTRTDHRIQLTKRLEMIDRIWKSDSEFFNNYRKEVSQEEYRVSYELLKFQLFKADKKNAKDTLVRMRRIVEYGDSNKLLLGFLLVYLPGSSYMLVFLRYFFSLLR